MNDESVKEQAPKIHTSRVSIYQVPFSGPRMYIAVPTKKHHAPKNVHSSADSAMALAGLPNTPPASLLIRTHFQMEEQVMTKEPIKNPYSPINFVSL